MSDFIFKVEDKDFYIPENYLEKDSFTVTSSPKNYDFIWDRELPAESIKKLMSINEKNILLIDKNIFSLYFDNSINFRDNVYIFDALEENKDVYHALELISFLEEKNFTKSESLIVVGGGIVEDIGAFVGAVFKRGIKWIYFPTTLLSMCDSCIGGKTGLNYNGVKNQIALFSSPAKVILNINFLKTLKDEDIKSGLGEIFKLLITGGRNTFDLYNNLVTFGKVHNFDDYKKLILSSLYVKKAIIEEDEFETNYRKSLNYGHTLGHAIEVMSSFKIPHGQAVSLGIIIANKIGLSYGYLKKEIYEEVKKSVLSIVDKNSIKDLNIEKVLDLIKKDKKVKGNEISFVSISDIGNTVFIKVKIDNKLFEEIKDIFNSEF